MIIVSTLICIVVFWLALAILVHAEYVATHKLMLGLCLVVIVIAYVTGQAETRQHLENKAISASVAEYTVDSKTGEVSFEFKKCTESK